VFPLVLAHEDTHVDRLSCEYLTVHLCDGFHCVLRVLLRHERYSFGHLLFQALLVLYAGLVDFDGDEFPLLFELGRQLFLFDVLVKLFYL